ncbi:hypothetical protein STEG23_029762, partial [Scotinomys teguina]
IVRETPISGVRTFYTDANKQGKAGYKSEDLSKVVQSPYNSVQKSELYAILLVLMDFSEPLNIVTDSQYAERVVLHIETAEFIPDESELTSLFIQLQDIIRNRKHPLYITHIRSHTGLPGPLAQVFSFVYDYETCQLLAAPIYFREDMGIEEPADGVNFHSGKSNPSTLTGRWQAVTEASRLDSLVYAAAAETAAAAAAAAAAAVATNNRETASNKVEGEDEHLPTPTDL